MHWQKKSSIRQAVSTRALVAGLWSCVIVGAVIFFHDYPGHSHWEFLHEIVKGTAEAGGQLLDLDSDDHYVGEDLVANNLACTEEECITAEPDDTVPFSYYHFANAGVRPPPRYLTMYQFQTHLRSLFPVTINCSYLKIITLYVVCILLQSMIISEYRNMQFRTVHCTV